MSSKLISVAEVDLPISAVCNNPVGSLTPVPFMKMFSSARPKRLANSLLRYAYTGKFMSAMKVLFSLERTASL